MDKTSFRNFQVPSFLSAKHHLENDVLPTCTSSNGAVEVNKITETASNVDTAKASTTTAAIGTSSLHSNDSKLENISTSSHLNYSEECLKKSDPIVHLPVTSNALVISVGEDNVETHNCQQFKCSSSSTTNTCNSISNQGCICYPNFPALSHQSIINHENKDNNVELALSSHSVEQTSSAVYPLMHVKTVYNETSLAQQTATDSKVSTDCHGSNVFSSQLSSACESNNSKNKKSICNFELLDDILNEEMETESTAPSDLGCQVIETEYTTPSDFDQKDVESESAAPSDFDRIGKETERAAPSYFGQRDMKTGSALLSDFDLKNCNVGSLDSENECVTGETVNENHSHFSAQITNGTNVAVNVSINESICHSYDISSIAVTSRHDLLTSKHRATHETSSNLTSDLNLKLPAVSKITKQYFTSTPCEAVQNSLDRSVVNSCNYLTRTAGNGSPRTPCNNASSEIPCNGFSRTPFNDVNGTSSKEPTNIAYGSPANMLSHCQVMEGPNSPSIQSLLKKLGSNTNTRKRRASSSENCPSASVIKMCKLKGHISQMREILSISRTEGVSASTNSLTSVAAQIQPSQTNPRDDPCVSDSEGQRDDLSCADSENTNPSQVRCQIKKKLLLKINW